MASDTDICNIALSYLGANKIIDISDKTFEADICLLNYANVRDAVLEDVNWTFATKRIVLKSPDDPPPLFGFSNSFTLTNDILRVIRVNNNRGEWVKEGNKILIDSDTIEIMAIVQVTDPQRFPASFISAFASRLAAEIALPITSSSKHQDKMITMYTAKKKWAIGNDGRQGVNRARTNSRRNIR